MLGEATSAQSNFTLFLYLLIVPYTLKHCSEDTQALIYVTPTNKSLDNILKV